MQLYKNDQLLGVMQSSGLTGPLSWAFESYDYDECVQITAQPPPPTPTAKELKTAAARSKRVAKAEQERREAQVARRAQGLPCECGECEHCWFQRMEQNPLYAA